MSIDNAVQVVRAARQWHIYRAKSSIVNYIAWFQNYGERAGRTISHPHSQLMSFPVVPEEVLHQVEFSRPNRYIVAESDTTPDIKGLKLYENERFVSVFPSTPKFTFQAHIFPKRSAHFFFGDLAEYEIYDFADALQKTLKMIMGLPATFRRLYPDEAEKNQERFADDNIAYNFAMMSSPPTSNVVLGRQWRWYMNVYARTQHLGGLETGYGLSSLGIRPERAAELLRSSLG